jgi:hypothetical protein
MHRWPDRKQWIDVQYTTVKSSPTTSFLIYSLTKSTETRMALSQWPTCDLNEWRRWSINYTYPPWLQALSSSFSIYLLCELFFCSMHIYGEVFSSISSKKWRFSLHLKVWTIWRVLPFPNWPCKYSIREGLIRKEIKFEILYTFMHACWCLRVLNLLRMMKIYASWERERESERERPAYQVESISQPDRFYCLVINILHCFSQKSLNLVNIIVSAITRTYIYIYIYIYI